MNTFRHTSTKLNVVEDIVQIDIKHQRTLAFNIVLFIFHKYTNTSEIRMQTLIIIRSFIASFDNYDTNTYRMKDDAVLEIITNTFICWEPVRRPKVKRRLV